MKIKTEYNPHTNEYDAWDDNSEPEWDGQNHKFHPEKQGHGKTEQEAIDDLKEQSGILCALKIPINEKERVNALLIGALRFLSTDQLVVLRDALISRTPSTTN